MSYLANTVSSLGPALLPLASVLLLEELTYGGLVRLLLRPKPDPEKSARQIWLLHGKRTKPYHPEGEGKCSR